MAGSLWKDEKLRSSIEAVKLFCQWLSDESMRNRQVILSLRSFFYWRVRYGRTKS
ncbi:hypothetical protein JCM6292_3370 [Bacteroides pyogenes JCM 6292]|uniref:Uncharacterized protein n=1 Tax=Bacteroides pyogenes JCM 6292 TaxID=1235809 RepID=W4PAS5_9BACE|nr:hypothetical protein JCM6292_3370 [Bacteroides pyogenes JCM 6292]